MPCSIAFLPASSAAIWAAYGVDLREPLKPMVPDDDQAMVLPCASVIVIIVLLKEALTCATPEEMFFFSRRRTLARGCACCSLAIWGKLREGRACLGGDARLDCAGDYLVTFFLPAIAIALPLRVRALVRVR